MKTRAASIAKVEGLESSALGDAYERIRVTLGEKIEGGHVPRWGPEEGGAQLETKAYKLVLSFSHQREDLNRKSLLEVSYLGEIPPVDLALIDEALRTWPTPFRYAQGRGEPPRHVSQIRRVGRGGLIVLAGGQRAQEQIEYKDATELMDSCHRLIQDKVVFAVGGHIAGPAEELGHWQLEGKLPERFIQISWRGPQHWQLHEISPGATPPWVLADLKELIQ